MVGTQRNLLRCDKFQHWLMVRAFLDWRKQALALKTPGPRGNHVVLALSTMTPQCLVDLGF